MKELKEQPKVYFARNYLMISLFIIPLTLIGISFIVFFTYPLITSVNNRLIFTQSDLWITVILNVLNLGLVVWAWLTGYIESSIEFSENRIRKGVIFYQKIIWWSEVTSIYMIGPRITIKSHDKEMQINVYYYREPDKLMLYVRDHYIRQGFSS